MEEQLVETCGSVKYKELLDKRRRVPGKPNKCHEPKQLWDRYQEIARRIILGQKNIQIANDLDITPANVSVVRNSDIVKAQLEKLQARADETTVDIGARIKDLAPKALDVLKELIEGSVDGETIPARTRAFHAEKLLDRAGYAAPKVVQSLNIHGHYTSDDIQRIKERAFNAATNANMVEVEDADDIQITTVKN